MTRSFPEKTLEHWCSIHLGYRYKAHLEMWWPSSGEDINVSRMPSAPGKRIWLELKTTEWIAKSASHELEIDLKQLERYGTGSIPDYYVFPVPQWSGHLQSGPTWLARLSPSSLAYQSKSRAKWFAEWTEVVSGSVLRRLLHAEIAAGLKKKVIARVAGGTLTWAPPVVGIARLPWKTFWEGMERCGSSVLGAQFLVSPSAAPFLGGPSNGGKPPSAASPAMGPSASRDLSRTDLALLLANLKADGEQIVTGMQLQAYSPKSDDVYQRVPLDVDVQGFKWKDAHRALVVMSLDALHFI